MPTPPAFELRDADWLSVDEAQERVLSAVSPLSAETVAAGEALGRALAEELRARAKLPPWDNSAMDGYAVRSADVSGASAGSPAQLRVTGELRAGGVPSRPVTPGECLRIMTGAPLPSGADAVVPVEDTDAEAREAGVVSVRVAAEAGKNVRPGGQDMSAGEVVLEAGTTLTPGALAVVAAAGHSSLRVARAPLVGILSSGDELRPADAFDDVVAGRGVPETNGPALAAAVSACGGIPVSLGIALDDERDIDRRIERGLDADALVTSGGASVGEADLVKRVMERMGLVLDFWRVRMRPGSPFSFGRLPRPDRPPLPVLGLPGNPASAFVTFELFARPMILRLAGHGKVHRRVLRVLAGEPLESTPRLVHFHRVILEGPPEAPVARLAGHQGSGLVRSLGRAAGLAVVPEGRERIAEGEPVDVILLDDAPGSSESAAYRVRPG